MDKVVLTLKEVANYLGVHPDTNKEADKEGEYLCI